MKDITNLCCKHSGHDIYIVGSGASLNFIDKSFFLNKIVIGVNHIYKLIYCNYIITHHHNVSDLILSKELNKRFKLIVARHESCILNAVRLPENYGNKNTYIYDHLNQAYREIDFSPVINLDINNPHNQLITGGTIIVDAIGLAYYLGASNIILCGVDGGTINGSVNANGYYNHAVNIKNQINHSVVTNAEIIKARDFLLQYGVNIYSLNPFINMGFEGNCFKSK
jgi:hypothetical protein